MGDTFELMHTLETLHPDECRDCWRRLHRARNGRGPERSRDSRSRSWSSCPKYCRRSIQSLGALVHAELADARGHGKDRNDREEDMRELPPALRVGSRLMRSTRRETRVPFRRHGPGGRRGSAEHRARGRGGCRTGRRRRDKRRSRNANRTSSTSTRRETVWSLITA